MNVTPNPSLSGFFNEYLNAAAPAQTANLSETGNKAVTSLASHDWFSAQSLDEGTLINAAQFEGSTQFADIEQAVSNIHSRLLAGAGD